jgi:guanine deaminase
MDDELFMRRAIELSRIKMRSDEGGPFGAVVVVGDQIVGEGWNQVTSHNDPTSHAEVVAIRAACRALETFSLEGGTIYASCEPCPMCLGAIYWSRLSRLVYANTTADAASIGFDDAELYRQVALPIGSRSILTQRLLQEEARAVFAEWEVKDDRVEY